MVDRPRVPWPTACATSARATWRRDDTDYAAVATKVGPLFSLRRSASVKKRGNGLLTTAGLLNGIFGEGPDLHVARWESIKVTDRFEETDENEVTTIRERERFTQSLTLVYADGTTSILNERTSEP